MPGVCLWIGERNRKERKKESEGSLVYSVGIRMEFSTKVKIKLVPST
jgi:hypothetical protein